MNSNLENSNDTDVTINIGYNIKDLKFDKNNFIN